MDQNSAIALIEPVSRTSKNILPIKRILIEKRSKYQHIIIAELAELGKSLILDGYTQSTVADEYIYHEALVHPAMITHPNPNKILIIGGGEGATLREVLKHPIKKVIMVDIDGELIELVKKYLSEIHKGSFEDPRAEIVIMDGKEYVKKCSEKFDVIIEDLTDVYSSEIAKSLYSSEFYKDVLRIMSSDGLLVTQAGNAFFFDKEYMYVLDSIKSAFPIVREYSIWVPSFGYAVNFILASRKYDPLDLKLADLEERVRRRGIITKLYSPTIHIGIMLGPTYKKLAK